MNIAICDNNPMHLNELCRIVDEVRKNKQTADGLKCKDSIYTFENADKFLNSVNMGNKYDVVMMDIDWQADNTGIDYCARLYDESPHTGVIYVTGYAEEYIEDIFMQTGNICGYLKKPVDKTKLEHLLDNVQNTITIGYNSNYGNGNCLTVSNRGDITNVPFNDIYKIQSDNHKVTIFTVNEDIVINKTLNDLEALLPPEFFRCHKSSLVNFKFVKRIIKNDIILYFNNTENKVNISRNRRAATIQAFNDYLEEG